MTTTNYRGPEGAWRQPADRDDTGAFKPKEESPAAAIGFELPEMPRATENGADSEQNGQFDYLGSEAVNALRNQMKSFTEQYGDAENDDVLAKGFASEYVDKHSPADEITKQHEVDMLVNALKMDESAWESGTQVNGGHGAEAPSGRDEMDEFKRILEQSNPQPKSESNIAPPDYAADDKKVAGRRTDESTQASEETKEGRHRRSGEDDERAQRDRELDEELGFAEADRRDVQSDPNRLASQTERTREKAADLSSEAVRMRHAQRDMFLAAVHESTQGRDTFTFPDDETNERALQSAINGRPATEDDPGRPSFAELRRAALEAQGITEGDPRYEDAMALLEKVSWDTMPDDEWRHKDSEEDAPYGSRVITEAIEEWEKEDAAAAEAAALLRAEEEAARAAQEDRLKGFAPPEDAADRMTNIVNDAESDDDSRKTSTEQDDKPVDPPLPPQVSFFDNIPDPDDDRNKIDNDDQKKDDKGDEPKGPNLLEIPTEYERSASFEEMVIARRYLAREMARRMNMSTEKYGEEDKKYYARLVEEHNAAVRTHAKHRFAQMQHDHAEFVKTLDPNDPERDEKIAQSLKNISEQVTKFLIAEQSATRDQAQRRYLDGSTWNKVKAVGNRIFGKEAKKRYKIPATIALGTAGAFLVAVAPGGAVVGTLLGVAKGAGIMGGRQFFRFSGRGLKEFGENAADLDKQISTGDKPEAFEDADNLLKAVDTMLGRGKSTFANEIAEQQASFELARKKGKRGLAWGALMATGVIGVREGLEMANGTYGVVKNMINPEHNPVRHPNVEPSNTGNPADKFTGQQNGPGINDGRSPGSSPWGRNGGVESTGPGTDSGGANPGAPTEQTPTRGGSQPGLWERFEATTTNKPSNGELADDLMKLADASPDGQIVVLDEGPYNTIVKELNIPPQYFDAIYKDPVLIGQLESRGWGYRLGNGGWGWARTGTVPPGVVEDIYRSMARNYYKT